jgi:hypothetical protein
MSDQATHGAVSAPAVENVAPVKDEAPSTQAKQEATKEEGVADVKDEAPSAQAKQEATEEEGVGDVKDENSKGETEVGGSGDGGPAASNGSSTAMLKTKGRVDYEKPAANNKFDPSTRPVTDNPDMIRTQVLTWQPTQ